MTAHSRNNCYSNRVLPGLANNGLTSQHTNLAIGVGIHARIPSFVRILCEARFMWACPETVQLILRCATMWAKSKINWD